MRIGRGELSHRRAQGVLLCFRFVCFAVFFLKSLNFSSHQRSERSNHPDGETVHDIDGGASTRNMQLLTATWWPFKMKRTTE